MSFIVEESIDAPVETVWRYLTEPAVMTRWMSAVDDMRTADGAPLATGSELIFTARGAERSSEVAVYEATKHLALRSVQGPVTAVYHYRLEDMGNATIARLEASCTINGLLKLFEPLLGYFIRRTDGGQLKDLARVIREDNSAGL